MNDGAVRTAALLARARGYLCSQWLVGVDVGASADSNSTTSLVALLARLRLRLCWHRLWVHLG